MPDIQQTKNKKKQIIKFSVLPNHLVVFTLIVFNFM
jgi:hypothetical protein